MRARPSALETFQEDLENALPTNFADAASGKRKKRNSCPFILYIHRGTEIRETFNRDTWKLLMEKMQEQIFDLAASGKAAPAIEWTGYKSGVGVIAPADQDSQTSMQHLVDSIDVAGEKFKAWPRGFPDNKLLVTIKAPPSMQNLSSGKIMMGLSAMNAIPQDSWRIYDSRKLDTRETLIRLVANPVAVARIKELDGIIRGGLTKLEVRHLGQRLRVSPQV